MSALVAPPSATASRTVSVVVSACLALKPASVSAFTAAWVSKVAAVMACFPGGRRASSIGFGAAPPGDGVAQPFHHAFEASDPFAERGDPLAEPVHVAMK